MQNSEILSPDLCGPVFAVIHTVHNLLWTKRNYCRFAVVLMTHSGPGRSPVSLPLSETIYRSAIGYAAECIECY